MKRCAWCGTDKLYIHYHDEQWGVPVHDDRMWFEMISLEGAQAGLSWITILKRREKYREAFDNFDVEKIAAYSEKKIQLLLDNSGIIRNKLKIQSVVANAKAFLLIQEKFGSFDTYIRNLLGEDQLHNQWKNSSDIPVTTPQSDKLSKDLKKRGFKFVGSTICYSLLQATGMINDHLVDCFRYQEIKNLTKT